MFVIIPLENLYQMTKSSLYSFKFLGLGPFISDFATTLKLVRNFRFLKVSPKNHYLPFYSPF